MDIGQFDLHAAMEDRHWWFVGRREIILDILRRYVPPHQGRHLLEIGCGAGGNLRFLLNYYRCTGLDIAPEAVRHSRERVSCPILEGDFRELSPELFHDVDVVLLADVLEHLEDDRGFLREIIQRLPPGGFVLMTVPAHDFLWSNHDLVLGHLRRYSRKSFSMLWEGFPVRRVYSTCFNSLLLPLIALYRFLPGGKGRGSDLTLPPPPLNRLLRAVLRLEKQLLKMRPIPWGVSLLTVLKKNE